MPTTTSKQISLRDLLVIKLRALYDIEQELVKALPKLAKAATDSDLKEGFTAHLSETKNHVRRLEDAFVELGEKPKKEKSEGIRGIAKDAEWIIKNIKDKKVLDAALIAGASYAEHYEMAGYMAAVEWARTLGEDEIALLLEETLGEEIAADHKLAALGKEKINERAELY